MFLESFYFFLEKEFILTNKIILKLSFFFIIIKLTLVEESPEDEDLITIDDTETEDEPNQIVFIAFTSHFFF